MTELDLIVVGGGVNGVGIARDAAMRGLKVALFEQHDLGAGTSGASSGMIHGGIRYMETDREITRLSCLDSGFIQGLSPHLLFRIPFLVPLVGDRLSSRIMLELTYVFFQLYDRFQPLKRGKQSARLDREELFRIEPGVTRDAIGAVTTDEWGINVFRLCVLNALDAQARGARIYLRHKVERFLRDPNGRVVGVAVRDLRTGHGREVRARLVFNAAGPWAERLAGLAGAKVKLRPAKGIHLVLDRRIVNSAVIATAVDKRQIMLQPYGQETWIGTTDDDYYGDPSDVQANHDEVEYLLQAVEHVYPSIRQHRLVRAFAGVRPTLFEYAELEDRLSREHRVYTHEAEGAAGLVSIAGGKLASYRHMAEEGVDVVCAQLGHNARCQTHSVPLPGGEATVDVGAFARRTGLDAYAAARLVHRHGTCAERIAERIQAAPETRAIVCVCEPVTEAEIRYVIDHEWVETLEDLRRRTHCGGGPCQGARCARRAATLIARARGEGSEAVEKLVSDFRWARWREQAPVLHQRGAAQAELGAWALRGSAS